MTQNSMDVNLPDSKQTLYLIDISSFIFRAFYAIRGLRTKKGEPTNAVYGVATMIARLVEEAKPEYLAVVYDSKEPSFRKEIYSEYKANRTAPPDDLVPQFGKIEKLIQLFGIHSYRMPRIEADDLIATLTRKWCDLSPQHKVIVVSGDKDLMQLISSQVKVWDTMNNRTYQSAEVEEKFGVRPDQMRDFLALVGDSSDNIPGVPSIGPKSASDLLREFGSLDKVLMAAKTGNIPGKKGELLNKHQSEALLSAELARVREDLKVEIPFENLKYHFRVTEDCIQYLKDLEFHSLVSKWSRESGSINKTEPSHFQSKLSKEESNRFRTLNQEVEFEKLVKLLESSSEFGLDLETTSLNPKEAQIVGISICYDPSFAVYIPIGHRHTKTPQLSKQYVLKTLKPVFENPKIKKIGQNLKYDWSILTEHGFHPAGIGADTMIAGYLLNPEGRHNLEKLSKIYLDYDIQTYEQVCGKGKDALCFDELSVEAATRYSAEDAWVAVHLWKNLKPLLEKENLTQVFFEVDLPLVEVLMEMELQGVCVDLDWLNKLSKEFENNLHEIESRIQAFTTGPINLNSPKQLAKLLFEDLNLPTQSKTKTGFSTDATVLDALAPIHEVPRLLLEYREISKLKGTYVDPIPHLIDPKTEKIHPSFHQTIAATGRLSSSDPNIQNIPIRSERGVRIRRAFIPSKGCLFLSADYSQIELRILAHMSQDSELLRSFKNNEDVHKRTACEIFNVHLEKVTDQQRSIAKAINFGLMYGKTPFGLSQELKIPRKEAQSMIARYFERYQGVKKFLDSQVAQAKEKGYVNSLLGRKRSLPDIQSKNAALRSVAERMAMNTPIQGTAADLMKLAMIEISKQLKSQNFKSKLIIQVHDEVLLDCPKNEIENVKDLVVSAMENAISLSVPLVVNTAIGESWMAL